MNTKSKEVSNKETPKKKELFATLELPPNIQAKLEGSLVQLTGPRGSLQRDFRHPLIKVSLTNQKVVFQPLRKKVTKREKKIIFTFQAHLRNMIKGVTQGHRYVLKICSGHFPMNVSISGHRLEVKNFLGEKLPRTITFDPNVQVKVEGGKIFIEGVNKELVSQTAASFEQLTRRRDYDRRIFQDGLYIIEKDGKPI